VTTQRGCPNNGLASRSIRTSHPAEGASQTGWGRKRSVRPGRRYPPARGPGQESDLRNWPKTSTYSYKLLTSRPNGRKATMFANVREHIRGFNSKHPSTPGGSGLRRTRLAGSVGQPAATTGRRFWDAQELARLTRLSPRSWAAGTGTQGIPPAFGARIRAASCSSPGWHLPRALFAIAKKNATGRGRRSLTCSLLSTAWGPWWAAGGQGMHDGRGGNGKTTGRSHALFPHLAGIPPTPAMCR